MTEAEILGAVRRFETRRKIGKGLLAFGLVGAALIAVQFIPFVQRDDDATASMVIAAAAAISVAAGLALLFTGRMPEEGRSPRIAMLRAEQLQSKRQIAFLLMPVSLLFMLVGVVGAADHVLHGRPLRDVELFSIICFLFFLVAFALLLAGRGLDRWAKPVLDDELSRALRAKALQFGYLVLLPGVGALFAIGLYARDLAIELAPVLAALGVAAPALRLYLLERAANAGFDEA